LIEFSINFKWGRGQIVFSISQITQQQSLATDLFERLNFEQSFLKPFFKELLAKLYKK